MADQGQQRLPLKTYRGNCHCAAFVYETQFPEIKSAFECNCSICYKKGYLLLFPALGTLKVVKGSLDELSTYSFGEGQTDHKVGEPLAANVDVTDRSGSTKFCPSCGTPVMAVRPSAAVEKSIGLNDKVHAIQGVNTWELERIPYNGKAVEQPYQSPKYTGKEPISKAENAKTYHGSCHCGAVTLALKSAPLDKDYPDKVLVCNCSVCERNAYVWIQPPAEAVAIQGEKNLVRYEFGRRIVAKTFCKTCGVHMTNGPSASLSDEQYAALSDGFKAWVDMSRALCPVNLRVLNEFDIKEIKEPERLTGGGEVKPKYVNP
ncbi:glutathione-dependent formaldehyde-activating enzyme [Apodospora peruviana]|uniref:Glutathione-dependent formaldehyde-activating enzyme n=1 Tax=Apodospora peruviana TaxID=516989 RepID=A0AAE0I029_9PEZI|nr:glutathione-dependent formaldehyde-activating enzyme [Apodospora peruviana]